MYFYRDNSDNNKGGGSHSARPLYADIDSEMDVNTTDNGSTVHHNDSADDDHDDTDDDDDGTDDDDDGTDDDGDGADDEEVEPSIEPAVNETQRDSSSGESCADSAPSNCDDQAHDSVEGSTEVQVDVPDRASTPLAAVGSMHDVASTVPASIDDTGSSVAQDDTPSWITDAKEYFLTIRAGEKWAEVVHHWMDIERRLGYPGGSVSPEFIAL